MSSCLLLMVLLISCSTSKKVATNKVEVDKSTIDIEEKKEEQKDIISLLNIDTTVNSDIFISITENETTSIDTAGNIKTEKNKQTNISNKRQQKGIVNSKIEDKSQNKETTELNQKNNTSKEATVTTSTKTKANMDWLYWLGITIIAVVIIYLSRSWIWKMIKKLLRL